jgi:hypothetical protein
VLQVPTAGAGLGGAFDVFQKEANEVMYAHYASEKKLDEALAKLIQQYKRHKAASTLFQELYNDRSKLCITYTRKLFTNGFVATVIAEAKNSSMKSGGRKAKMVKYNMSDQCKMLVGWETKLDAKALSQIMACLRLDNFQERPWSDFIEAAFDKAVKGCQQEVTEVLGECQFMLVSTVSDCYRL